MKCEIQSLSFSWKNKKTISKYCLLNFIHGMPCVRKWTSVSSDSSCLSDYSV